jgi:hypothetical protein
MSGGGSASPWGRYWYGIEINEANPSPDLTRIAGTDKMSYHATLPVHVNMRACLLLDNGVVNYYLDPLDWTKRVGGAASNLTGADGQVMIEIPAYYRKVDNPSGGIFQKKISIYPVAGFELIPKFYVAAYEAALDRIRLKLSSVKNLTTDYRGGNNTAAWDAANNSLLGKPATSISLINFRTYARARGSNKWNVLPWRQAMLLYELFMIEYATLNSQKAVNATLTVDGYRQGGLGAGVTAVGDLSTYNGYNPVIPCGQGDVLSSTTGEVAYQIPGFSLVNIPRYRGVENIFGHVWEWNDGASVFHEAAGGVSKFYTCDIPANFADGTAVNYDYRGNLPASEGYLKKMAYDAKGIMIPKEVGANSVTYFSDYFYTPGLVNYWVALLRGGFAINGATAGFASLNSNNAAAGADTYVGARLCYIP